MLKTNKQTLKKILPIVLLGILGLNITIAVGADDQLLDPSDPNNYINSYLKMTGNYTIDDLTLAEIYGKGAFYSIMQRDNFLCINEDGDFVFSFDFSNSGITDDLEENSISEYSQAKGLEGIEVKSKYIFSDDMNYLVENLTDIDAGETYLYNPTSAFTTASYPYLYIPNLYSATTAANTTIIVKQGATSTTILNEQLPTGSEFWYDLTEEFTPTTADNITISNSIIDSGVFIYSLDSNKVLKDTRYLTIYVGGDLVEASAKNVPTNQGPGPLLALASTYDRVSDIDCYHTTTSWGNQEILETGVLDRINLVDDLIDSIDDIKDYAISTAKIVNNLPSQAFEVAKEFCNAAVKKTTQIRDFCISMEGKTISSSKVTIDDPSDAFDKEGSEMNWWQWFKQNTKNCWDITKAGVAAILHGDSQAEWGVDVYTSIVDAQGEIEEAPTCLQSISNAMYKGIVWYMKYWKITVPITIAIGVLGLVGLALWAGKKFL